jgi:ElaB/YqjD/DUF883 family membrane-anchored ribosome-binding protein
MHNENLTDSVNAASSKLNREHMTSLAHNAVDRAADMQGQASEWLSERGEKLSATQKRLMENTTSYVSAHPLKSIGIAVAAALVVGRLLR